MPTIQWVNEPQPLRLDDYVQAKATLIQRVMGLEGVLAVYEHRKKGDAYDLGISDIDPAVVTEERLPEKTCQVLRALSKDPEIVKLLRAAVSAIPLSVFQDPTRQALSHLCLLAGSTQQVQTFSEAEGTMTRVFAAAEQAGRATISLMQRLHDRRWNVLGTLGNLKGVMHNALNALGPIEGWPEEFQDWWMRVSRLRHHWFSLGHERYEELVGLTQLGYLLSMRTCWKLDAIFKAEGLVGSGNTRFVLCPTPHRDLLCFIDSEAEQDRILSRLAARCQGWNVVCLPKTFYAQAIEMTAYASGSFRDLLVQCLGTDKPHPSTQLSELSKSVLGRRVRVQQAYLEFLESHRFPRIGCEGTWWLRLGRAAGSTKKSSHWLVNSFKGLGLQIQTAQVVLRAKATLFANAS